MELENADALPASQKVQLTDADDEKVPAGQLTQNNAAAAAGVTLYLPAWHDKQSALVALPKNVQRELNQKKYEGDIHHIRFVSISQSIN